MTILEKLAQAMDLARAGSDDALWRILNEVRREVLDVLKENTELREKCSLGEAQSRVEPAAQSQAKPEATYERNAAWTPDGKGPFCMTCHAQRGVLMPMIRNNAVYYRCPICKDSVAVYPEKLRGLFGTPPR